MYRVNLISTDFRNDWVASFVVSGRSPENILSITLLRSPNCESILNPDKRGATVSYEEDKS